MLRSKLKFLFAGLLTTVGFYTLLYTTVMGSPLSRTLVQLVGRESKAIVYIATFAHGQGSTTARSQTILHGHQDSTTAHGRTILHGRQDSTTTRSQTILHGHQDSTTAHGRTILRGRQDSTTSEIVMSTAAVAQKDVTTTQPPSQLHCSMCT